MRTWIVLAVAVVSLGAQPVHAERKKKGAGGETSESVKSEPSPAIAKLVGKFRWGMTPEEAIKIVTDDVIARYDEPIKKEKDALKQDRIRKHMQDDLQKVKDAYVKFDGQKTGWDVSIIDREFAQGNEESMQVIWEKNQRRFLFFYQGRLWKQFIAFNADNPVFEGKSFDDFADIIQRTYGPASVSFRKQRTSDEQTFDHLEWPASGDYVLWAVDMSNLYNNFCLSLFQSSKVAAVEKGREEHSPRHDRGNALVDQVTRPVTGGRDENSDVVDEITGRSTARKPDTTPQGSGKNKLPKK
jgi:hypothetical protein